MDKAFDETRNVFSPARFAQALERVEKAQGAFFRGPAKQEIEGFTRLMRHVERAGQYAENPPTDARTIPWLLGGTAALNAPLEAKAAAVSGVAPCAVDDQRRQTFPAGVVRLDAGSPAMAKSWCSGWNRCPGSPAQTLARHRQKKHRRCCATTRNGARELSLSQLPQL